MKSTAKKTYKTLPNKELKTKPFKLILFVFFIFHTPSFGQEKEVSFTDSILKYSNNNPDQLIYFSKQIQRTNNFCDVLSGLNSEAKGFYQKKDYETSENLIKRVLNIKETSKLNKTEIICLKRKKINALNRLFWIRNNQENYKEAYKSLVEAEKINETFSHKAVFYYRYKLNIQMSKALIKTKLNLFDEAKDILIKSYKEIEKTPFSDSINFNSILLQKANIANSIGQNYLSLSKEKSNISFIDSADIYYKKAYEISKDFRPKHSDSEIVYYLKKTEIFIAKKEYQKAINLINNYPRINKDYNYHHFQSFQKTICFYNLKDVDSTLFYANLFLKKKSEKCKRSNLITIYDIISNQYYNLNKPDSAYKYSKLTLKEFNTAKENKEKTFQLLYDNDFNKIENLNNSLKLGNNNNNKYILLLLISCAIPFIIFFFTKRKKLIPETVEDFIVETEKKEPTKKNYNLDPVLENKIIEKLQKIEENHEYIKADFSINKLADSLKTNTSYLSYFFNQNKKTSFKLYYSNLKMNYLIQKLKQDKMYRKYTIEALGKEIGYNNPSAFTRAFKKHTGTTPSLFIKSLKD